MSLTEFVSMIRRRLLIIGVITLAVAGGVTAWTLRSPTMYEAEASLFVSLSGTPVTVPVDVPEEYQEVVEAAREAAAEAAAESNTALPPSTGFSAPPAVQFVDPEVRPIQAEVIDSYAELAEGEPLLENVAQRLEGDYDVSASALAGRVTVTHPPQSQLIDVTVRDGDPGRAADIANEVGREVSRSVRRWEREPGVPPAVRVNVAAPASEPTAPASPHVQRNIIFGFVVGIALALGAAIIREIFDTRLREPGTVRDLLDLPVLATIDYDRRLRSHSMLLQQEELDREEITQERLAELWARSRVAEEYRQLRVNLEFFRLSGRNRSIAVTSSRPGEGKTTTAGNLAITMALAGESVALVDCDLRNPAINDSLGIKQRAGLTDVLIGRADLDAALVEGRRLGVLTAGSIPPNPTELLGSQAMADLLVELQNRFGAVVIDTPPTLPFADPAVLAPLCGATLVVVRMNHTRAAELDRAAATLRGVDARICGTVVNMVKSRSLRRSGYYYSYYYSDGHKTRDEHDLSGSGFADLVPRRMNGRSLDGVAADGERSGERDEH